jgi:leucyl-tRNA---protein transferase
MSAGDENLPMSSALMSAELERYFYDVPAKCPYGLPFMALYHQALLGRVPDGVMSQFMAAGFRRSGNNLYMMLCPECRQCIPIRLDITEFQPNRSQQRAWKKNQDLVVTIGPMQATDEKLALCNRFLQERYPGRGNSADEYYFGFFLSTITNTMEIEYRTDDGRLLGVAVVDVGADWLNAVYFYFDPQVQKRSLGTFNILYLLEICKKWRIRHLYLGYWIKNVKAMKYKFGFRPHQLLIDSHWAHSPVDLSS